MSAGRPSKYQPAYAESAEKLCRLGATDVELADFFGVATSTIYLWQTVHPEFSEALKAGKDVADERVARSLYHKAVGYTFEAEKVFQYQGEIVRATTREHVPPSDTAAIFWLKNRRKDEWRDRVVNEHTGADGGPIQNEHTLAEEDRARLDRLATGQLASLYHETARSAGDTRKDSVH